MFSKTVVVGVDGSPESRAALRFALEDAHRRGAQVKAVTAYLSPEYWAASYGLSALPTIEEVVEDNVIVAREALQAVVAGAPALADVPVDIVALPGAPAKVLLEQAQDAELLVVGHRGRGGFKSAVLGSVGMHCVLHATVPVTVVRPQQEPADAPRVGTPRRSRPRCPDRTTRYSLSSRRKPIFTVTCQSATAPSARWPRTSTISNQSMLRSVWFARATALRIAASTPCGDVPTSSAMR